MQADDSLQKARAIQAALMDLATNLGELPTPDAGSRSDPDATAAKTESILHSATPLFATLRSLGRSAADDARRAKAQVAQARGDLDEQRLAMQNLLYERNQLLMEIESCRSFRSIYEEVPLHSLEDFTSLAPEELRTPEILADPHRLQLARLEFELQERQRLEKEKESLATQRGALQRQNADKKRALGALDQRLRRMLELGRDVEAGLAEV